MWKDISLNKQRQLNCCGFLLWGDYRYQGNHFWESTITADTASIQATCNYLAATMVNLWTVLFHHFPRSVNLCPKYLGWFFANLLAHLRAIPHQLGTRKFLWIFRITHLVNLAIINSIASTLEGGQVHNLHIIIIGS